MDEPIQRALRHRALVIVAALINALVLLPTFF
jgi:hypothetical protein